MGPPLSIQIPIVKSAICYSTVKVGCFDILRNENASTDMLSKHQGPLSAPHLVGVVGLCLLLYLSLNFALWEHPQDQCLCTPIVNASWLKKLYLSVVIKIHTRLTPAVTSLCRTSSICDVDYRTPVLINRKCASKHGDCLLFFSFSTTFPRLLMK